MLRMRMMAVWAAYAVILCAGVLAAAPARAQYYALWVKHNGKCIDVPRTDNGTGLTIYDCHGRENQLWKIDGMMIKSKQTGRCIDATKNEVGAIVTAHDCHGGRNQLWRFRPNGQIVNDESGKCLDVDRAGNDNGTRIIMWYCAGEPAHQTFYSDVEYEKWFKLYQVNTIAAADGVGEVARTLASIGGEIGAELLKAGLEEGLGPIGAMGGEIIILAGTIATGQEPGDQAVSVLNKIDSFTGDEDDLYIEINGNKIRPTDARHLHVKAGHREYIDFEMPLVEDIELGLWEHDDVSSDDSLGGMKIQPSHEVRKTHVLVGNEEEGSIYEIVYEVYLRKRR